MDLIEMENKNSVFDNNIIYIGSWEHIDNAMIGKRDFVKAFLMFESQDIKIVAQGDIHFSYDGEEVTTDFKRHFAKGIHNVMIFASKDTVIEAIYVDKILNIDETMLDKIIKEYNEIEKGRDIVFEEDIKTIPFAAHLLNEGVCLKGRFGKIFNWNIERLKRCYNEPDFVESKAISGDFPGTRGWSGWLPAANDARILGGVSRSMKWSDDAELVKIRDSIVDSIEKRARDDGYYGYYGEDKSFAADVLPQSRFVAHYEYSREEEPAFDGRPRKQTDWETVLYSERKNYDRMFWTLGMVSAYASGNKKALEIANNMYKWLEKSKYASRLLYGHNMTNAFFGKSCSR